MSHIPTRRATRSTLRPSSAVGDENANPPVTRLRAPKTSGVTTATSASLAKRAPTRAEPADKGKEQAADSGVKRAAVQDVSRKRAALGEVLNSKANVSGAAPAAAGGKGDEKKAAATARPVIVRRTTRLSAAAAEQKVAEQAVARPQPRRKNTAVLDEQTAPASNIQPVARVPAPSASLKTAIPQPSRPHKRNLQPSASTELDERYKVQEPTQKRIRTSDAVEPQHDEARMGAPAASTSTVAALEADEMEVDWDDLDAEDALDPQMVAEYVHDILGYMRELEIKTMPNPEYMDDQPAVEWKMRGILMDWLVEVHYKFRLLPETLFLAANIVDRFLSSRVVSLPRLQLVGITCLFIAAKYEEVVCPSINNFLFMAEGGYTIEEMLKAERYVLTTLDFDLSYPNPIHFLRRISKADAYDINTRTIAKCLMELSCVDHAFIAIPPSLLAAAGMWLARFVMDREEWDANLTHYSGYTEAELLPTAQLMVDYFFMDRSVRHDAFERKWASKKYMKAIIFMRNFASRWDDHELIEHFRAGEIGTLEYEVERRGPLQMDLIREQRRRARARAAK